MSNDLKYVLLPTTEDRHRTPKFQPWSKDSAKYRERIKMKYPCHIDTKNWKFVKDGLDDFRDGLPPSHEDIILEPDKGPGPVVLSETRRIKANASDIRHRLSDHQIYFSRELPNAEKRRRIIDNYISTLLDHPMAFFTHFSQTLTPDTYERVTKLLEAELLRMNGDEQSICTEEQKENLSTSPSVPPTRPETGNTEQTSSEQSIGSNNHHLPDISGSKSSSTRPGRSTIMYDEEGNQWDADELEKKQRNPYRWFIDRQREKQKAKGPTQDEEATSAMETRLRKVSEQFCTWLYDLNGEKNVDIDPAVVRNLFSTAYDTKPSLSVPIKIVETTRIPPELRDGVKESMVAGPEQRKLTLPELRTSSSVAKLSKSFTLPTSQQNPSRKYRYGAWYLPRSLWQRSLIADELRDPKVIRAEREDVTRKRDEEANARLASLHGVDAFKDYLMEKNVRRLPKLITDIEQYRRDNPREMTDSAVDFFAKETS